MPTDRIGPVLRRIVDSAAATVTPAPGRVIHHVPGARPTWDQCDCDGQIWGRIVSMIPGATQARGTAAPCGIIHWTVTLAVGIIRCIHTVDDNGNIPTPEEIDADGQQMLDDLAALEEAIKCDEDVLTMVSWVPHLQQGGCSGGEWTFTIRLMNCGCP